jgi:hypothetical protein
VQILAALFIDELDMRQVPGPATRIDLKGVQFSAPAPEPVPYTWTPHLVVLVRCPRDESGVGALEVVFSPEGGDDVLARNVQPLQIEPGRFGRQLVRPEITFQEYVTIEAHCRIDLGPATVVPFTLLPPLGG